MKDKKTFGRFIQLKRKESGMSQKELAEKLYVTESAVSKWERGISYPDITMISGICEALSITEHELCSASVDNRQRKLEQTAESYRRFKAGYSVITGLCYLAAIIPCFIVFIIKEQTPSKFFILLTSLMLTASIVNVPVLAEKHRGLKVLGSFWLSLNLLLLSGCMYSGGDWFIMAFLSVLMGVSIIFIPFIVRSELLSDYIGKNKALVCMAADTLLIMAVIAYGTLKYGNFYDFKSGMLSAVWCFAVVWAVFALIRYLNVNALFKAAACFGAAALWIILANPVMQFLIDGTYVAFISEDFRSAVLVSLVSAVIAIVLAIGGVMIKMRRKND